MFIFNLLFIFLIKWIRFHMLSNIYIQIVRFLLVLLLYLWLISFIHLSFHLRSFFIWFDSSVIISCFLLCLNIIIFIRSMVIWLHHIIWKIHRMWRLSIREHKRRIYHIRRRLDYIKSIYMWLLIITCIWIVKLMKASSLLLLFIVMLRHIKWRWTSPHLIRIIYTWWRIELGYLFIFIWFIR